MGIIPHFLLQCAFQSAFHFAFQNAFHPQPYCRLGFEKSVTPFPKGSRTHSQSEPVTQAAISILYGVPSPAPMHAHVRARTHTYARTRVHARTRAYARTRTHTRTHTRVRTHTRTRATRNAQRAYRLIRHYRVPRAASAPCLTRAAYGPDTRRLWA